MVDIYKKEQSIKRHDKTPIAYKLSKENVNFILNEINKNKTITIEDLQTKLKKKFAELELSKMTIYRIIKDNNITLKLTRLIHEPVKIFGKDVDINKNLKEFYKEIKKHKIKDIICIDETTLNALQKKHHCYNDIGK